MQATKHGISCIDSTNKHCVASTASQPAIAHLQLGYFCEPMVSVITAGLTSVLLQDHFFQPVLGQMVKLVFLSSGVHQIVFSIRSTLPFAVGQVQDVGLIFLSAMATSVVDACHQAGKNSDVTLGTVLVTLLLTTLLVGVLIILTGTHATTTLCKTLCALLRRWHHTSNYCLCALEFVQSYMPFHRVCTLTCHYREWYAMQRNAYFCCCSCFKLLLSMHCIALHCIALHCIALHCIAQAQLQVQISHELWQHAHTFCDKHCIICIGAC